MVLQVSNHMPIFSIDPKAVMGTDELSCDGDMRLEWGCMTEESFTAGVCPEAEVCACVCGGVPATHKRRELMELPREEN